MSEKKITIDYNEYLELVKIKESIGAGKKVVLTNFYSKTDNTSVSMSGDVPHISDYLGSLRFISLDEDYFYMEEGDAISEVKKHYEEQLKELNIELSKIQSIFHNRIEELKGYYLSKAKKKFLGLF